MKSWMNKDSVWFGMALGLIIPIVVYGILYLLYGLLDALGVFTDVSFAEDFRTRTLTLVSICANLILMQTYKKSHFHQESIRGILLSTMLFVVIWFFSFGIKILKF